MEKTITITRGNQYDTDGYMITDGTLSSWGSKDSAKPGGYTLDGNLYPWCFGSHENEINDAILATMIDGLTRIIQIAPPKSELIRPTFGHGFWSGNRNQNPCPKCGTYCYGDCGC